MLIINIDKEFWSNGSKSRGLLESFLQNHDGRRIEIREYKSKRSNSQNAYYWFYLGIIERETGNNANELHEYYKRVFLPPKFITVKRKEGDVNVKIPATTTDLSKVDFGEYLDKICADCGVPLPDPEEAGFISNY